MKYDVLIIDDEKELADNTCDYLKMFDVKTYACYSKEEFNEFLKDKKNRTYWFISQWIKKSELIQTFNYYFKRGW